MAFDALEVAVQIAAELRVPLEKIQRRDRDLAGQLRRATSSVALNIGEARRRDGKDRVHLFRVAAGSAAEVRTGLALAEAWGYLGAVELESVRSLLDRQLAMLWRLTHQRRA